MRFRVGDVISNEPVDANTATYVYGLRAPGEEIIRYVGSSAKPVYRLQSHISDIRQSCQSPKQDWVQSLVESGLQPEMVILECCTFEESYIVERKWIELLGDCLLNGNAPPSAKRLVPRKPKTRTVATDVLLVRCNHCELQQESMDAAIASGWMCDRESDIDICGNCRFWLPSVTA
jgi:hypothetical protein